MLVGEYTRKYWLQERRGELAIRQKRVGDYFFRNGKRIRNIFRLTSVGSNGLILRITHMTEESKRK